MATSLRAGAQPPVGCASLVALLWASLPCACNDYKFAMTLDSGTSTGTADSSVVDSDSDASVDSPDSDTSPDQCVDLTIADAAVASSPPTCHPLDPVSWELTEKLDIRSSVDDTPLSTAAWPVILPVPGDLASTIYFQAFENEDGNIVAVDGMTGAESWRLWDVQHDINGLSISRSRDGENLWLGAADLTSDTEMWLTVVDVAKFTWQPSDYVPAYLNPTSRDLDHDGVPEFVTDGAVLDLSPNLLWKMDTLFAGIYAMPGELFADGFAEVVNSARRWGAEVVTVAW